jgi:glycosyltransferase involved in cell wall biosynthesis
MALILKKYSNESKGIIIFTHKEIFPIFSSQKSIMLELKKKYFIGVHTGNYSKEVSFPNEIDFFLSSKSLLNEKYLDKLIPICSRNFLGSEFKFQNIKNKRFDICCSNRAYKIKNTKLLLSAIKNLNKKGVFVEVLFILPKAKNENKLDFDSDIFDFYNNLFNEKEKKYITFIRLSSELDFLGINQKTISWFLNNSKIFFAGSTKEGTCKASHEALLCGCKILYKENTKSAIPDYLNDKNSRSFDTISNLEIKIMELI